MGFSQAHTYIHTQQGVAIYTLNDGNYIPDQRMLYIGRTINILYNCVVVCAC